MTPAYQQNKSFSPELPRLQLLWDSTSLGTLKECPRKYYYTMIEGWQSKKEAGPLTFGIWYHIGIETYHKVVAETGDHQHAVREMVKRCMRLSWGVTLEDPLRTRWNLIRTLVWHCTTFGQNDVFKTYIRDDGTAAAELSFKFDLGIEAPTGETYAAAGHLDRVAEFAGKLWVLDAKTTTTTLNESYFKRYNPDNQMSLYTLAGQVVLHEPVAGVLIDAAQIAVNFSRFDRHQVPRTKGHIHEWHRELLWWIDQAAQMAERAAEIDDPVAAYPQNDKSCFLCGFKEVCSRDPKVRHSVLSTSFVPKVWDPSQPR